MSKFKKELLEAVVMQLIGPIDPVGETNTDNKRYENLKTLTELVERLFVNLNDVVYLNHSSRECSRKRAAEFVQKFFKGMGVEE